MAQTYNVSKLNECAINSTSATTGEVRSTDISDESDWSVEVADGETDPEGQTYFTVSRMEGTIIIDDYDFGFTDTMNSGDTLEGRMAANQVVYVQLVLEGGTLQDSSSNTWFQVKPVVSPVGDVSTDDSLLKPQLEFTHSDYGGVQRI